MIVIEDIQEGQSEHAHLLYKGQLCTQQQEHEYLQYLSMSMYTSATVV